MKIQIRSEIDNKTIAKNRETDKRESALLYIYADYKNKSAEERGQASKELISIRKVRYDTLQNLRKDNRVLLESDPLADEVHDAILTNEVLPKGYSSQIIDSYYNPIYKHYTTVARVYLPSGENYIVDVPTYDFREIGSFVPILPREAGV